LSTTTSRWRDPLQAETLPQLIRASASAYGTEPAITLRRKDGSSDSLSFTQLEQRSAELARGLLSRGIGKGCRVGFICGNGPMFAVIFAAIARCGAIAVPVSTFIKANELVRVLKQSDITGLIVQRELLGKDLVERLCDALPELSESRTPELCLHEAPFLRWVVSEGKNLPAAVRALSWLSEPAEAFSPELLAAVENEVHPTDQAVEIYTSGSMALPKGVRHNHGPVLFRTHFLRRMTPMEQGQERSVPMPMFWVGGLMMFLLPNLEFGVHSVCSEATTTDSRSAMGSVLAEDDIIKMPPGYTIWALGMTETLGPYSYGDELRADGFPLCAPLDHIAERFEIRLADENDLVVSPGEAGEIQVRGYALTPGLHKMERENYFTADGFYRTGDLGRYEGTRIHFVGRDGDMIKTVGSNVSPAEVRTSAARRSWSAARTLRTSSACLAVMTLGESGIAADLSPDGNVTSPAQKVCPMPKYQRPRGSCARLVRGRP
jgi:acyl-CoA synthetase (AMP-forming)/AMP-acid ligase II